MLLRTVSRFIILLLGFVVTYALLLYLFTSSSTGAYIVKNAVETVGLRQHKVIGFLPYWFVGKVDKDYTEYLTTLSYFGFTITSNGSIQKYDKPGEVEPGWYALTSGKLDDILAQARQKNVTLSLTVFSGDQDAIMELVSDPTVHAATLIEEVAPIMQKYHFTDLNIDIESVFQASESARENFTVFIGEVRRLMDEKRLGTLSIDSSPTDLIKTRLIDIKGIAPYIHKIILMTYDYHYGGSIIAGAVAPNFGAGIDSEFDVQTGVEKAMEVLPKEKIIMGVPLYGYRWETITESTRSATISGSGVVVSNRTMEEFLVSCATCSATYDAVSNEQHVVYRDADTGTFYQAYYPDIMTMKEKIRLANNYGLGGVALWALGYDGKDILLPLKDYKHSLE